MSTPPAKIILAIWKMATNDKEKIREFSDLRRLQLPTRLEISNFRSDVNASTSTDSISQTSGNVNPSGKNISRTSGQRASTTTFQCRLLSCCRPLNSLKASAIAEALLRYFFNTQDNASFTLNIQYMRYGDFCQSLFAKTDRVLLQQSSFYCYLSCRCADLLEGGDSRYRSRAWLIHAWLHLWGVSSTLALAFRQTPA